MSKKALLCVDVQVDFCEGGSMGVEGGNNIAKDISSYIRSGGSDQYDLIVFSRDWHDPDTDNGGHFAGDPDFVDTWPAHCVQGTPGAEFHPAMNYVAKDAIVDKGMDEPAYSAFQGYTSSGQPFTDYLRDNDITEVDIVGIAFDYCVKATALDAVKNGFTTYVIWQLTASVNPDNDEQVIAEMVAEGVTL